MIFKKYLALILISFIISNPVYAASTDCDVPEPRKLSDRKIYEHLKIKKMGVFKNGLNAVKKAKKYEKKGKKIKANKKFNKAIEFLTLANKECPNQPVILNYLGFSLRKVGDLPMAEIYYLQGLEIDPNHIVINQYLGELYVNTNRIDKAKDILKVLEACNCEEFAKLKNAIKLESSKY